MPVEQVAPCKEVNECAQQAGEGSHNQAGQARGLQGGGAARPKAKGAGRPLLGLQVQETGVHGAMGPFLAAHLPARRENQELSLRVDSSQRAVLSCCCEGLT